MKSAKKTTVSAISLFEPPVEVPVQELGKRTATVKAWIEAKAGAEGTPFNPRKNSPPLVIIYKVKGKMFAILSLRGVADVILKCDPVLITMLRRGYAGVGHRSHLDRRFLGRHVRRRLLRFGTRTDRHPSRSSSFGAESAALRSSQSCNANAGLLRTVPSRKCVS